MDWFKIGKGVCQGCILLPCLFNFYAEYIMWNARPDKWLDGIKFGRRNINNLRYADDSTQMMECEEELKSLFMTVKEESEKAGVTLSTQKTKIMVFGPIISWQIDEEIVTHYFLGLQSHCGQWVLPQNYKTFAPQKKSYDKPRQHIKKQRDHFA